MPNNAYRQSFLVRLDDLDAWSHLRSNSLIRYMEQTATDLTTLTGFGPDWYEAKGTAFTIRSFRLQRFHPAKIGDDLTVSTWISSSQRVRLSLDFEVRQPDDRPVAVGRADWVYIDRHRRRPQALDPAILATWPTGNSSSLWTATTALADPLPHEPHTMIHPVYCYDADTLGVTSFAVYPIWLEEAARQALRSWGYQIELPHPGTVHSWIDLHTSDIHYLGPTSPGETVSIITRHAGADAAGQYVAVTQEIRSSEEQRLRAETLFQLCSKTE